MTNTTDTDTDTKVRESLALATKAFADLVRRRPIVDAESARSQAQMLHAFVLGLAKEHGPEAAEVMRPAWASMRAAMARAGVSREVVVPILATILPLLEEERPATRGAHPDTWDTRPRTRR